MKTVEELEEEVTEYTKLGREIITSYTTEGGVSARLHARLKQLEKLVKRHEQYARY